jgi:hypothetical protein
LAATRSNFCSSRRLFGKSKEKQDIKPSSNSDSNRHQSENKENSKLQPQRHVAGESKSDRHSLEEIVSAGSKTSNKSESGKSGKLPQAEWLQKQQEALREFEESKRLREEKSRNRSSPPMASVAPSDTTDVPSEFICPISQEIMTDPVLLTSGNCYDRSSIEQWLRTKNTDPLTNVPLQSKTLIPNRPLRGLIEQHSSAAQSRRS